mmetsp:Transcript_35358/g.110524  ORF Transcript_35358/g.110524 Transcript_35358/m.110524 type:complete len:211 (+) Transcript_35358:369-1001(+)
MCGGEQHEARSLDIGGVSQSWVLAQARSPSAFVACVVDGEALALKNTFPFSLQVLPLRQAPRPLQASSLTSLAQLVVLSLRLNTVSPYFESPFTWHFTRRACWTFRPLLAFGPRRTLRACGSFVSFRPGRSGRSRRTDSSWTWRPCWPWRSDPCLKVQDSLILSKQHLVVCIIDCNLIVQVCYFHSVGGQFFCHSLQEIAPSTGETSFLR